MRRLRRRKAVIIVGHGSRVRGFETAMKRVARAVASRTADEILCAYLEIAHPSVDEAVDRLAARGFSSIRVLPYFLQSGRHVREDLPKIVREAAEKRPHVKLTLCAYLGFDRRLVSVVESRLRESAR